MISVKGGTQTWSSSPQRTDFKSDGAQNISASDKDKYFDNEAIGDTLNKVADPGYVDTSKKMRSVGNNQLGKDAFMTLLLTQMKNQDPTNPLKSHEMAAQLAQFTSLEKLNNINEGIENLRKDNVPDHNFQALALIGKTVTMDNSKITRNDTAESHDLRFLLPQDAQKTTIQIKDAAGNVVHTSDLKGLKAGPNQVMWNGKTDDGATVPTGDYTLAVEAFGSNGKKLYVQTKADGVITGVNFTAHGAQLLMGKTVISMSDVKSISDPNAGNQNVMPVGAAPAGIPGMPMPQAPGMPPGMPAPAMAPNMAPISPVAAAMAQAQQAVAPSAPGSHMIPISAADSQPHPSVGPKKVEVKPEHKLNAAKRATLAKGDLNDAAMSQGLINHLNKEGAKAGM